MARRFHSLTSYAPVIPFDAASFKKSILNFIASDETIVFVAENDKRVYGMAAALVYPSWWNHAHMCGQELFWWIDEDMRGGRAAIVLFNELERWAKRKGARSFSMVHTPDLAVRGLIKLYERRGYKQWDHFFTKEL